MRLDSDHINIGSAEEHLMMTESKYMKAYDKSKTGKDLVLQFLSYLFSIEELVAHSFYGDTKRGKDALNQNYRFRAIIVQAMVQFPGCTATKALKGQLVECINSKCRKSSK